MTYIIISKYDMIPHAGVHTDHAIRYISIMQNIRKGINVCEYVQVLQSRLYFLTQPI